MTLQKLVLNTMRREIVRNPSKTNLSRLPELEIEFRVFEMDKICFINGSMISNFSDCFARVGGNRSKERDRKSEFVLGSTNQIFEWDRNFHFWETNRIAADRIF